MWQIVKKDFSQFYASITGFMAVGIFLLLLGLVLFVFPNSSLLSFGYANVDAFFSYVPLVLLFLIPAIGMRSFADEYKQGNFEILKTLPLSPNKIVMGKFLGSFAISVVAILPTIIYPISMQMLSADAGIDVAAVVGSYIGLLFLVACFCAICVCTSSFTNNAIIAFLAGSFLCFLLLTGFEALSKLSFIKGSFDYAVEILGINFHYKAMSGGLIALKNVGYFVLVIGCFLYITQKRIR